MMPRNNSRRSVGLYAIIAGSLLSTATAAGQVDQIGTKYEALHTGLAQLFPEPWRTLCLKDTDFTSPGAFAITSACKASNENELSDCTPECVKWFEDFGPECKLLEDAAKLEVVRAVNKGKPTSDETKALMAWYVLSSTVVCPHAPTLSLSLSRSLAFSLSQVRFLHGEELQRWVLTSNATRPCAVTHTLSLSHSRCTHRSPETTSATESDIVEHLQEYKEKKEEKHAEFLAAMEKEEDEAKETVKAGGY